MRRRRFSPSSPGVSLLLWIVLAACGGGSGGDGDGPSPDAAPTAMATVEPASGTAPLEVTFDASGSSDPDGSIASYEWAFGDGATATGVTATHTYTAGGSYTVTLTVTDDAGGTAVWTGTVEVWRGPGEPPPDPSSQAPPLELGMSFADAVSFLYTGTDPIQTDVDPAAVQSRRVAVIRGRVLDRDGSPLPGVTVAVLGHPEFGRTVSREDGMFDLAVNGGGWLTVTYAKDDHLPAQRRVWAPWNGFASSPDVRLVRLDPRVTTVDLSAPGMKVARGTRVSDDDGERQATLLVPEGVVATAVLPDGTEQSLSTLSIRATEYTVGEDGPEAMPGPLPPTSMYTYALEYSADEAARATRVAFDRPLVHYSEDFLGFPVGSAVPIGYYDREKGAWFASENGRVVRVVGEADGLAQLDTDGDGAAEDSSTLETLGVTGDELRQVAELYAPGQTLWRVPIPHFTPWDCNWPYGPPLDAEPPPPVDPGPLAPRAPSSPDDGAPGGDPCRRKGSVLVCENQELGEEIPVTGTPFKLVYRSGRTPGYEKGEGLRFDLSEGPFPGSVETVRIVAHGSGEWAFSAAAGPVFQVSLPTDPYGRSRWTGLPPLSGTLGYCYTPVYYPVRADFEYAFARLAGAMSSGGTGGGDGSGGGAAVMGRTASQICISRPWSAPASARLRSPEVDAAAFRLGGWSLDVHHVYDPDTGTVFLGDGTQQTANPPGRSLLVRIPGIECDPSFDRVVAAPDGAFYYSRFAGGPIGAVTSEGEVVDFFAGHTWITFPVGPEPSDPSHADINASAVAIGPLRYGIPESPDPSGPPPEEVPAGGEEGEPEQDGSVLAYSPEEPPGRAAGEPVTAGRTLPAASPREPGDMREYGIYFLHWVAGGSPYADGYPYYWSVGYLGPEGVRIIAGLRGPGFAGDGGPALEARFQDPEAIAVAPDGTVYIADTGNYRVRAIGPDGIVTTVAGTGEAGTDGEDVPAVQARLLGPRDLALGPDGTLYILDGDTSQGYRVRSVTPDGRIRTVAGGGGGVPPAGGNPLAMRLRRVSAVAVDAIGTLYLMETQRRLLLRIRGDKAEVVAGGGDVPSSGGLTAVLGDQIYFHGTPADVVVGPDGLPTLWGSENAGCA